MSEYRVQLDVFTGPLDLLLYLIRRDELDIQDVPVAHITEQYLEYVRVLEQLDPNAAGEFLVMAATLLEIKSRALLPSPPLEPLEGEIEDPRSMLVRQLLEYKRFKDAARALGSAADDRAKRYVRQPVDLPKELQGVELEEVQVWDLLEAFNRVMTAIGQGPTQHKVLYDDTPIERYAAEIVAILEGRSPTMFEALFDGQFTRAAIVGRFLALLELIRSHRIRAEQDRNFGTIYLFILIEVEEEPAAEMAAPNAVPHEGELSASSAASGPASGTASDAVSGAASGTAFDTAFDEASDAASAEDGTPAASPLLPREGVGGGFLSDEGDPHPTLPLEGGGLGAEPAAPIDEKAPPGVVPSVPRDGVPSFPPDVVPSEPSQPPSSENPNAQAQ